MVKRFLGALAAAVLVVAGLGLTAPTAQALFPATEQMLKLCGKAPVDGSTCSIGVDAQYLDPDPEEGTTLKVTVRGTPGVTVPISAIVTELNTVTGVFFYTSVSDPVMVTPKKAKASDAVGVARVSIPTRALPRPHTTNSWLVVQTSDWTPSYEYVYNSADRFAWMERTRVVSKRPQDKGSEAAPTRDGAFTRLLFNASGSARYSVQLKKGDGWVAVDANGPVKGIGSGTTKLPAQLPTGLVSGRYQIRVVNVTDGHTDLTLALPELQLDWKLSTDSKLFNVYTTPGTWDYNGRKWKTSCEAYSATERCRTEIWATQILYQAGTFNRVNGWAFNNLTYKPSPRSLWKGNPLGGHGTVGHTGEWRAADGRQWRVECDTATSGRNGCRSYAMAKVAEPVSAGATTYHVVDKWLFNNIVQFG